MERLLHTLNMIDVESFSVLLVSAKANHGYNIAPPLGLFDNLRDPGRTADISGIDPETVHSLIRIDHVRADHSFQVVARREGVYQWDWSPGWTSVGSGWDHSFFWPTLSGGIPGNWTFEMYLDTGNGYALLDTESFVIW